MIQRDRLADQAKKNAAAIVDMVGRPRWGLVTSVRNTDTGYEAKVKFQPEDILSGWLPVLSPFVGGGWGLVCPPTPGQQVFVIPDMGHADHGVVVGMAYSNQSMPPQPGGAPVAPTQFALVHKNGSYLLFNDDDVVLVTNRDLNATVGRNLVADVKQGASITAEQGDVNITASAAQVNLSAARQINFSAPKIGGDADGRGGSASWTFHGDLAVTGEVRARSPGDGSAGGVHLSSHIHTQGSDTHGDGERPTDPPVSGS